VAKARSSAAAQTLNEAVGADLMRQVESPADWLRRIVELRRAGHDAEADRELTRFRQVYPDTRIPDDALK
jgi:hypothetical protein